MKYTKPDKAIRWLRGESSQWGSDQEADILAFLDSLPDEFEIVEPGNVQVKWPKELTRERLNQLADYRSSATDSVAALQALSAIAPEEKKKRKVALWIRYCEDRYIPKSPDWEPCGVEAMEWRKVGECEVTE